jgi:hypothetical protein
VFHMKQLIIVSLLTALLTACGPSEAELQATTVAGQATSAAIDAGQTAIAIVATAEQADRDRADQATATAAALATAEADVCSREKVRAYGLAIDRELEIYRGLLDIAGSTSRIALAGPRQELQRQRFVVKDIEAPPCLAGFEVRLLDMMKQQELGFEIFVLDTSISGEVLAGQTIDAANETLRDLRGQLIVIRSGMVPVRYQDRSDDSTD